MKFINKMRNVANTVTTVGTLTFGFFNPVPAIIIAATLILVERSLKETEQTNQ